MKWFFVTPNQAKEIHKIPFSDSDLKIEEFYLYAKEGKAIADIIENDGDFPDVVNFGLPNELYADYQILIVDKRQASATDQYLVKKVIYTGETNE